MKILMVAGSIFGAIVAYYVATLMIQRGIADFIAYAIGLLIFAIWLMFLFALTRRRSQYSSMYEERGLRKK